jgi:hypothetical protein
VLAVPDRALRAIVRAWVYRRQPLTPEVAALLREVGDNGVVNLRAAVASGVKTLEWVQNNRKMLLALLDMASVAAREAEHFLELSGPEKRDYARDLVMAALDDLGLTARGSFLDSIIEGFVEIVMDAVVFLFNKRNVFNHALKPA